MYNLPISNFKKRIINVYGSKTSEKLVPVSEKTEILNGLKVDDIVIDEGSMIVDDNQIVKNIN